jgi:hypothetical protein
VRGDSPAEIRDAYLSQIRYVLGCLGELDVRGQRFTASGEPLTLSVNHGRPIALRSVTAPLGLRIRQTCSVTQDREARRRERWQLTIIEYAYTLFQPPQDETAALIAWHCHPFVPGAEAPHLHLYSAVARHAVIANSHIPTGFTNLEDVIRYLLRDWQVRSPLQRSEWQERLQTATTARARE